MTSLTMQAALSEAERKARGYSRTPQELLFIRAKAEFDTLDQLSRTRALTTPESLALERAMKRMQEWEIAA